MELKTPNKETPAAKKKGTCNPNLLNMPPIAGPITNPNANAEPRIPKFFDLFSGEELSDTIAWATEIFPPVRPSNILATNNIKRLLASANNTNEIQVPIKLMTNKGFRPYLSERAPIN